VTFTKEQQEEILREWLADMRSGKFKQGAGRLECNGLNCCLGVLCRTFDRLHPGEIIIEQFEPEISGDIEMEFDGCGGLLPESVRDAAGLTTASGNITSESDLAGMNDMGDPFSQIADFIESRPKGLFTED
jgi:hypothetical protein